ncbi:MAG: phosphoribosylglycinamide formyltransferase [Bacteroidia bacterium]|nr:phosphoribosylglycinamide formyltransferase [Bacteroidia bacterium]
MENPASGNFNLAIFASGTGSNAVKIMEYFRNHPQIQVKLIVSDNPEAGVLTKAEEFHVPAVVLSRQEVRNEATLAEVMQRFKIDWIILAGYLRLIPEGFVKLYPNRIINIHPALLPDFGGKGMYGIHVHKAVIAASVPVSGITIHFVDEKYDHGKPVFRKTLTIEEGWSPEELQKEILKLEHHYFPRVIEAVCLNQLFEDKI